VIGDWLKGAALLFVFVVLQVSAAPQVSPYAGGPDLVIVLVASLALLRGCEAAAVAGFAGGLLVDAMLFAPLGTFSLLYVLAGYGAGRYLERRQEQALVSFQAPPRPHPRLLIITAAALVQVGYALLQALLGRGFPFTVVLFQQVLPSLIQTGILALLLYPLVARLFRPRTALDVHAIPVPTP
jgi:rod shape-determining protein MreD